MSYKVLHITPHFGGGVGKVLINFLNKVKDSKIYKHSVLSIDFINDKAKNTLLDNNISFDDLVYSKQELILKEIKKSDIVIIHWWNHPLLFDFMVKSKLPKCRLLIWSNVSGNDVPQNFSHKLFDYSDFFIFTTPISLLTDEVISYKDTNKLHNIWSTGGLAETRNIQKKEHKGFNIGYIGSLDFTKLHPNFIDICANINIPDVKFIICGDGCDKENLIQQTKKLNIYDKFEFTGYIDDITKYLEIFDVFGYPLNPTHYGTCDQVIAEAMGSGIVPIVFDNPMERYMVHNTFSGLVAKDEQEYIYNIYNIYNDKIFKRLLEKNAKDTAILRFEIDAIIRLWEDFFEKALHKPKTEKTWSGKYSGNNTTYFQVFLESIGDYAEIFENDNKEQAKQLLKSYSWKSKTKGTPIHYHSFFDDDKLKELVDIIENQHLKD